MHQITDRGRHDQAREIRVLWSKEGNGLGEGVAKCHPSGHSSRFLLAPPSIPASVVAEGGRPIGVDRRASQGDGPITLPNPC